MSIDFKYYSALCDLELEEKILNILVECDKDFYPTLSSKRKPKGKDKSIRAKLQMYINEKKSEGYDYILIYDNKKLIGFANLSFELEWDEVGELGEHIHFDTLCLLPECRNKGIGQQVYALFENILRSKGIEGIISRSTWSLHTTQIHLFTKQGFKLYRELDIPDIENVKVLCFIKEF